jgi:hypothetical protein
MAGCIAASIRILPMAFVNVPFGFASSNFDSYLAIPSLLFLSRSIFRTMAKLPLRCALKLIGYEDPEDLVGAYQYSISPRLRFK